MAIEKNFGHTLFVDDDGYICFNDTNFECGPGLLWILHSSGWEAYEIGSNSANPISLTDEITYPTDDEQADAAQFYEVYCDNKEQK